MVCREPRDGGAKRSCSTATRWRPARRISSSAAREHSPDHRLLAWSCRRDGLGVSIRCACAISQRGDDLADIVPDAAGARCGPRMQPRSTTCGSTPTIGPRASIATGSARRPSDDALVYEEPDSAFFVVARAELQSRPLRRDLGPRSRDLGILAHRSHRSDAAAAGRGARHLGAVRRRASPALGRRSRRW